MYIHICRHKTFRNNCLFITWRECEQRPQYRAFNAAAAARLTCAVFLGADALKCTIFMRKSFFFSQYINNNDDIHNALDLVANNNTTDACAHFHERTMSWQWSRCCVVFSCFSHVTHICAFYTVGGVTMLNDFLGKNRHTAYVRFFLCVGFLLVFSWWHTFFIWVPV